MYGLINQGLKEMVCRDWGDPVWRRVCESANIAPEDFELLRPYDDSHTYQLVKSIAAIQNIPEDQVLMNYGHYWVAYTAKQGYGPLMDLFGRNFRTCLKNLNRMHSHMGAMMPELNPPRFEVRELNDSSVEVHYSSSRVGLVPMVHGLLKGLADKFDERVRINVRSMSASHDSAVFLLHFVAV